MALDAALDLFLGSACAGCARPGRALCAACRDRLPTGGRPRTPVDPPPGLAPVLAAGPYEGALKALINQHKEQRRWALTRPLGLVLASVVADVVPEGSVFLVPVPAGGATVRGRGHDPLLRMARSAAGQLRRGGRDAGVARLLRIVRRPTDQSALSARDRLPNLAGAMRARSRAVGMAGCTTPTGSGTGSGTGSWTGSGVLVVVDDVVTTGATAWEAQRALGAAGLPIAGIAVVAATELRRSLPIRPAAD